MLKPDIIALLGFEPRSTDPESAMLSLLSDLTTTQQGYSQKRDRKFKNLSNHKDKEKIFKNICITAIIYYALVA